MLPHCCSLTPWCVTLALICDAFSHSLQELHISWDDKSDKLCLDAACFSDISKLRRLQNLALHFAEGSGMAYYEPYTLAPLAQTLTALDLNGTRSLPLVLSITGGFVPRVIALLRGSAQSSFLARQSVDSGHAVSACNLSPITDCTNLRRLKLTRVTRAAGTPEMIVEVARSLPLLQELQLASITGRIARVRACALVLVCLWWGGEAAVEALLATYLANKLCMHMQWSCACMALVVTFVSTTQRHSLFTRQPCCLV